MSKETDKLVDLAEEISNQIETFEEEIEELRGVKAELEVYEHDESLPELRPDTLIDQLKNKILVNLSRNLELEELEGIEEYQKLRFKTLRRNYIDF